MPKDWEFKARLATEDPDSKKKKKVSKDQNSKDLCFCGKSLDLGSMGGVGC